MKLLRLYRLPFLEEGAFGTLLDETGWPIAVTLEPTYRRLGELYVKIPAGGHVCRRSFFYKGGYETFEVEGIPGHNLIKLHIGNEEEDSEGCILLGTRFGLLEGRKAILGSKVAFEAFMDRYRHLETFGLDVRNAA